jgi:RNA polymerase sigma-70 factor (ECF subfamily)
VGDYRNGGSVPGTYEELATRFGSAIARLARATEADSGRADELTQEMHVALWKSLAAYDGRCSERTWVFRVAHNVAASHVRKERRKRDPISLDADLPSDDPLFDDLQRRQGLERCHLLIGQLGSLDRTLLLLYLEGLEAREIAGIVGISTANVSQRIHRAKALLVRQSNGDTP